MEQNILKTDFFRHQKSDDVCWIYDRKTIDKQSGEENVLQLIIPDDDDKPNAEAFDYLLVILNNLEKVEKDCLSLIKFFLNLKGDFYLQSIDILNKNTDRHSAEAILFFVCDDDIYIYIEVGLIKLRSHYVLVKFY